MEDEPWDILPENDSFQFESDATDEDELQRDLSSLEVDDYDDEKEDNENIDIDDDDAIDYDEQEEDEEEDDRECTDSHKECEDWADNGQCSSNAVFSEVCTLTNDQLDDMIEQHEEQRVYKKEAKKYFGLKQKIRSEKAKEIILSSYRYMKEVVMKEDRFETVRKGCLNRDRECAEMAAQGHCQKQISQTTDGTNEGEENDSSPEFYDDWMDTNCPVACMSCHRLIFEERCPWNKTNEFDTWAPGNGLNKMFERIEADPQWQERGLIVHSRDPWVVTIDNFTTPEECERLIEMGGRVGYERSMDVGELQHDGTYGDSLNDGRTSTNAWCDDECWTNNITGKVLQRIENLTDTPYNYSEHMQLLRYQPGQYYNQHHDYIDHLADRAEGVRILTVFLYLNDVEEGGATSFPTLDPPIMVQPKRGRVLLWPSVLDSNPSEVDDRTEHEAQPVTKGFKYGANVWVHLRDFKTVHEKECTS